MSEYSEKLKDPRWQRLRLIIFQRDNYTCRFCGDTIQQQHVHHTQYIKHLEPWEYPERYLITLCCVCHKKETDHRWQADKELSTALSQIGFSFSDIALLTEALIEYKYEVVAFLRDKVFDRYTPKK